MIYEKLLELAVKKPRILVIGDVMLDCHVHCEVTGLSPEDELTPKLRELHKTYAPGGAANVALNLKTMGADPILAGVVGLDAEFKTLEKLLGESDVRNILEKDSSRPTTLKTRYLTQRGRHIARIDREITAPVGQDYMNELTGYLCGLQVDAVIVSDYAKGIVSPILMKFLKAFMAPVIVDPKGKDFGKYGEVFAITPNAHEFETDNHALYVIQTLGEHGCRVWRRDDHDTIHKPFASVTSRVRTMGDPTGCGDSFIAAFSMAIASGWPVIDSCKLGNAAGAISFDHTGAYAVRHDQLLSEVQHSEGVIP